MSASGPSGPLVYFFFCPSDPKSEEKKSRKSTNKKSGLNRADSDQQKEKSALNFRMLTTVDISPVYAVDTSVTNTLD